MDKGIIDSPPCVQHTVPLPAGVAVDAIKYYGGRTTWRGFRTMFCSSLIPPGGQRMYKQRTGQTTYRRM